MKKVQNQGEAVLLELIKIAGKLNCSIFESALEFCKENETDIEDFMDIIDIHTIEVLKKSAIQQRMVRKKYYSNSRELPFI